MRSGEIDQPDCIRFFDLNGLSVQLLGMAVTVNTNVRRVSLLIVAKGRKRKRHSQ
jgi:hypothetical protein